MRKLITVTKIVIIILLLSIRLEAALFKNLPYTIKQPDGTEIECFVSGDEFFNYLHDAEGYTIIQGPDGYYYYAEKDGNDVKPSRYRVNSVNPKLVGLQKNVLISPELYKQRRRQFFLQPNKVTKTSHTGVIQNIVIYIRFSDQTEFTTPRQVFDDKFNKKPGKSLKTYYEEVSYNKLTINSTHYPVCDMTTNLSYQDPYPRSYYMPYNATTNPNGYQPHERNQREQTLLKNAINYVKSQIPQNLEIDNDNDGYVDNICFIIRGNSGAWADLLWAHRYWWVYGTPPTINGKIVNDYTFQPENQNDVQTLCHEMFHSLGAPDLYHYSYDGYTTAGPWDLMESGSGHMCAYMKWKYARQSWITNIPEITQSGVYTLKPLLSETNNCYLLRTNASIEQFFVLEYRKKTANTFEDELPGSGLLVWRIDPTAGDGNADGPPDEVWVIRPGSTNPSENGFVSLAFLSAQSGRTVVNNYSNPMAFLQDGTPANLDIFNISEADSIISFIVGINSPPHADFRISANNIIENQSIIFTDYSSGNPFQWEWEFEGGNPSTFNGRTPPPVVYSTPGVYSVSLKVTNDFGNDFIVKENIITVSPNFVDCQSSQEITCNQVLTGSNVGLISNARKYNCSSDKFTGPEKIYHFNLTENSDVSITLSEETNQHLYVMLLKECSPYNCFKMSTNNIYASSVESGLYYIVVDGYNGAEGDFKIKLECLPTSIQENSHNNWDLSIYPNPASDVLNVNFANLVYEIPDFELLSLNGSFTYRLKPMSYQNNVFQFDVKNLNAGLYILRVKNNHICINKKIHILKNN